MTQQPLDPVFPSPAAVRIMLAADLENALLSGSDVYGVLDSIQPRVTKRNGLWHAYRFGHWLGASSSWEKAQKAALTGRWEW